MLKESGSFRISTEPTPCPLIYPGPTVTLYPPLPILNLPSRRHELPAKLLLGRPRNDFQQISGDILDVAQRLWRDAERCSSSETPFSVDHPRRQDKGVEPRILGIDLHGVPVDKDLGGAVGGVGEGRLVVRVIRSDQSSPKDLLLLFLLQIRFILDGAGDLPEECRP